MLLYLDTSALVKLYVDERDSDRVIESLAAAQQAATSALAYVEARAAFARAHRLGALTLPELRRAKQRLEGDWPKWAVVDVSDAILRRAADLAEGFSLRGYDSVHLASSDYVRSFADGFAFGAFDDDLNRAAALLGMEAVFN